ncbi:MAG TPA: DUF4097 family beta strand repeat-containing protein, partial [Rhodanobacteraceae bacterium]
MRRMMTVLAFVPATLFASHYHSGVSVNFQGDAVSDCSQMRVTYDDEPAATAEEAVNVGNPRALVIRAPQNGGIQVGSSDRYEVRACKAAAPGVSLNDVRVRFDGNALTADGPDNQQWVVYFLVRVPRGASLDLSTHNGPISLRRVDGSVTARAVNGPISLRESSGTLDIQTTNGPISIDGGSGNAKLNATNGPVTVKLRGSTWDGTLDARTENGPVSLHIPASFRSGVVVESDGHGPVSCRADVCQNAKRSWDDEDNRRIEINSGPTAVHLSTVNGPVSVRSSEE